MYDDVKTQEQMEYATEEQLETCIAERVAHTAVLWKHVVDHLIEIGELAREIDSRGNAATTSDSRFTDRHALIRSFAGMCHDLRPVLGGVEFREDEDGRDAARLDFLLDVLRDAVKAYG